METKDAARPVAANLQYAGAYRASLEEAQRTGKCVFCQPEFRQQALFVDHQHGWFAINVREGYRQPDRSGKKPAVQLLFVPFVHGDDTEFLNVIEFIAITELLRQCKEKFGIDGGCLFYRDGNPDRCGRTVRHRHVCITTFRNSCLERAGTTHGPRR